MTSPSVPGEVPPVDGLRLADLLAALRWRGMVHDATPGLEARLASGVPIAGYNGFDPSAPTLHVGHLVPIFGLIQLQRHGGRPVALVGGATGMIGDPSGRSTERNLLDHDALAANAASIHGQLERFLDFSPGPTQAVMANNLDWLRDVTMLDFLRDVGKHFTVPYMLAKDSVQVRLERGLSYTEFSYMLLQAADFAHLHRTMGVELQMGGADQWGNITAGLELIRRTAGGSDEHDPAFGLAYPLLLSTSGAKFGKTEGDESVWLDATRTSPFAFYQYWVNTDDRDIGTYLRWFTLLTAAEIADLETSLAARPEERAAQRAMAADITTRVHGAGAARRARVASEAMFGSGPLDDPAILRDLHGEVDSFDFTEAELRSGALRFAVSSNTYASNSEARRGIEQGSLWINEQRIESPDEVPTLIDREFVVIRTGKRRKRIGRLKRD